MNKKATGSDVAKRAKVSRTAVSLVLSGAKNARLSEATRQRVLKAAAELHYTPNASGRSLARRRTETVGLVLRDLALLDVDPYLPPLLNGIIQRSREEGYGVLVESVQIGRPGDPFGDLMNSGRIDGMILENPDMGNDSVDRLIKAGRPIVVLGSVGLEEEYSVAIDDQHAGRLATRHLISLGRRRIGHITYAQQGILANDRRLAGYFDAMRAANMPILPELIVHADFSSQSGYEAMKRLLASEFGAPDAVFAGSDAIGFGVLAAVHDAGLKVPEDVAVVGIDDIKAAALSRPSLTSVSSNPYEAGKEAANILVDLMAGRTPKEKKFLVKTELVVRGSTTLNYNYSR